MFDIGNASGFMFDCDGTLLDTLGAWEEAERALFAQTGPLTREQEDEIHSAPIERAAEIFHVKYGVGESPEEILAHLDGRLLPYYSQVAEALPGAVEFVRSVSENGVPCVVVSSSPRRYLEAGLSRVGILDRFVALITTDEAGCSKQQPEIYSRAVEALGSDVESTWAVDDAPYAIAVMHGFGLKTICVGERNSEHADLNIASLIELKNSQKGIPPF